MRRTAAAALLSLLSAVLWAQPSPVITTNSGSPLLLEISIPDEEHRITSVAVETDYSYLSYDFAPDPERDSVSLAVSPFLGAGVYDIEIVIGMEEDGDSHEYRSPARVGFVDFVFGRDNLRFGNNADYESAIGTFGEILDEWINHRFRELSDAELVPVVDYLYQFFGSRSGRCYAFSGTEVRYWKWPDLLPTYYDETYDLFGSAQRNQRAMNYLQLDMAFNHFLTGRTDPTGAPDGDPDGSVRESILAEVEEIVRRITDGEPVVVGLMGPGLHHAMVVYGFIRHSAGVDLLVANNWKSDQDVNIRSENAEVVRINPDAGEDELLAEWLYRDGSRERGINRLFIVEVLRDYQHNPEHLEALISARLNRLRSDERAIIIVEDAAGAWLSDGERKTGYERNRNKEEMEDVWYERIKRSYRFEFPANAPLTLEIADNTGSRILYYNPGDDTTGEIAWIEGTAEPQNETIYRRVDLTTDTYSELIAEAD